MANPLDKAFDALISVESFPFEHLLTVARRLEASPSYIPRYCRRFIIESEDDWRAGHALNALAWVKHYNAAIKETCLAVLRDLKCGIGDKKSALRVLAHHARSLKASFFERLLPSLAEQYQVSLVTALLAAMPDLPPDARQDVLKVALAAPVPNDAEQRWSVGTSVIDLAKTNEAEYLQCLTKIDGPHAKALVLIGLVETKKKIHAPLEDAIRQLAAVDSLARWYYERYIEVYRNPVNAPPSPLFSPAVVEYLRQIRGEPRE